MNRIVKITLPVIILIFITKIPAGAQLVINEFTTSTQEDWAELRLSGTNLTSMDVSTLYITMYYGTNENIADEPVTIYSSDRAETPYDDRFIVVHFTTYEKNDETDSTGDTDQNGHLDVYCNNYSGTFWNSDGVIAIDGDDDPSNNGIIDFAAYSNRDGSPNNTIASYIEHASLYGHWDLGPDPQLSSIDIGPDGLGTTCSVIRRGTVDTNSQQDFTVTRVPTPGSENILLDSQKTKKLFKLYKKKMFISKNGNSAQNKISMFIYQQVNLSLRIYSCTGLLLYKSPSNNIINPGPHSIQYKPIQNSYPTGLYIGYIEASCKSLRKTEQKKCIIIIGR